MLGLLDLEAATERNQLKKKTWPTCLRTLCVRCAQERGFQPPEVLTPPATPLALQARSPEDGSTDSEEEEAG